MGMHVDIARRAAEVGTASMLAAGVGKARGDLRIALVRGPIVSTLRAFK